MTTIADQVKALENARAAKAARMADVMQVSVDEGRTMEGKECEEFDELEAEIKQIDADLVRLRTVEKMNGQAAIKTVEAEGNSINAASSSRGAPTVITTPKEVEDTFEGQSFTRMAIAKAVAKKEGIPAWQYAESRWGKSNPQLVEVMKANVPGHGSGSGEPGSELVSADNRYTGDFIEFLDAATVFNQLPLREVPANVTIKGQDGAAAANWVGESKAIPMSTASFMDVQLTPLKVAALSVLSNELLRDSSPAAEALVRDALVQACAQRIDTTFISSAAAVAGVSPAGILNGVTGKTASGTDGSALLTDIKTLYADFITNKNATGLWYIMNPALAKSISLMRNALDQREFPSLTANGGNLEGDMVVTGENVTVTDMVLLKPSDIWRIGMGGIEISISEHATIEMADDPAGESDTPTGQDPLKAPVNMFQTESTAIKVVRSLNFAKRRTDAVQYVNNAAYSS